MGKKKAKSASNLPALRIDFSRSIAANILDADGLISTEEQASILGWNKTKMELFNSFYTDWMYRTIPMVCSGDTCPMAANCPIGDKDGYKDKKCPVETIEAFKTLAGYVRELGITPDNHTDIKHVINLVRLDIMLMRLDVEESIHGVIEEQVHSVVQNRGQVVSARVFSPASKAKLEIMTQQQKIWQGLNASREARNKNKPGGTGDLSDLLSRR